MAKESVDISRRKPAQQRSRERVELILQATGEVIRKHGVDGLTPSAIAHEASIPASAIYQYFENSDAVLRSFLDKEFERIALAIAESVLALETVSFRSLFGAVAQAHAEYFWSHSETIAFWIEGRQNSVVAETVSLHSGRLGQFMHSAAKRADLIKPETPAWATEVAIRTFDRVFEYIFSEQLSKREQQEIIDVFLDVLASYADLHYVNKRGAEGIPASEFIAALAGGETVEPTGFWAGTPK